MRFIKSMWRVSRLNGLWLVLLLLLFTGCTKQEEELALNEQEASIEDYIDALDEESYVEVLVDNGVWRVVLDYDGVDGELALTAERGDSLIFDYAAYVFDSGSGMFFDTSKPELAETMGLSRDLSEYVPVEIVLGVGEVISGLDRGLTGVKEGEHCYVIFSARHGFGNTYTGVVPELSALMYEVWVERVKKD